MVRGRGVNAKVAPWKIDLFYDLMLNQFDSAEPLAAEMTAAASGGLTPFRRVIAIPSDPGVASFESAGRSLLDLKPASPAVAALGAWEIRA